MHILGELNEIMKKLTIIAFIATFFMLGCEKDRSNYQTAKTINDPKEAFESILKTGQKLNKKNILTNSNFNIDWGSKITIKDSIIMYPIKVENVLELSVDGKNPVSVSGRVYLVAKKNDDWKFSVNVFFPNDFSEQQSFSGKMVSWDYFAGSSSYTNFLNGYPLRKNQNMDGSDKNSLVSGWVSACTRTDAYVNGVYNTTSVSCTYLYIPGTPEEWQVPQPTDGPAGEGGIESALQFLALQPARVVNLSQRLKCFDPISTTPDTKYKVTIHVHDAVAGSPNIDYSRGQVGHAYITMEKTTGTSTQSLTFGFYPNQDSWITVTNNAVASAIGEEAANNIRRSDIRYTVDISSSDFSNLSFKARDSATKFYDLNDYNCTNYAIEVFNAAMSSDKKLSVPNSSTTGYKTPSALHKKLADMKQQGTPGISDQSIKAPTSTNCGN